MPIASTVRFVHGTLPTAAPTGYTYLGFNDSGILCSVDENGVVTEYANGVYPGMDTLSFHFARNSGTVTDQYLRTINGLPCNVSSYVLPWDATLKGMSINTELSATWIAEVRKNGLLAVEDSLTATTQTKNHSNSKITNFLAGDTIQVYLNGTAIPYPEVVLFFKRR